MVQDAYIVSAQRTPVGKAPRGLLRHARPDDLLAHVLRGALANIPQLDLSLIDDVIIGCAMPEAEQGLNVARIASLLAGLPHQVSGVTVNRFCASGLQAIAWAADKIRLGEADIMIAGGVESMSLIPMGGHHFAMNPVVFHNDNISIAYGMGITAERVANRWNIAREDQDQFAINSHHKAHEASQQGFFKTEILPYLVREALPSSDGQTVTLQVREMLQDEGIRLDTNLAQLAQLRPSFALTGSVTAGNSSQMSDGAAALILMSEKAMQRFGAKPLARFVGYAVTGIAPEIMGAAPIQTIPKALKQVNLSINDIDWIELNEAFAAQSLAVIRALDLPTHRVNPQGGAIALGHPLGATGAIRATTLIHGLQRTQGRYGMVTMCVGTGMGAAGIFERV